MSKNMIAVFGATGFQGSSVLRALVKSGSYHIRAITRNASSEKAKKLEGLQNVSIFQADLDDADTVHAALSGCYGVFLVTDFSTHFTNTEVQQGKTVIDSAIKNGLKHVIFSGLENVESVIHKPCLHFDYKAEIENYGLQNGNKVIFTSVRLPCYYENFTGYCIYKVKSEEYLVNIPVQNTPMYGMSVDDIGECVSSIFENPEEYKSRLIGLAGDILTLSEYLSIMNKYLSPIKFIDSNLTIEKYASLGFPGAKDLAAMFEFVQGMKF